MPTKLQSDHSPNTGIRKSPKKFTQHQLAAIIVLREFFKTDYRGIEQIIKDSVDLQRVLELVEIPHYTTIQKAAHRIKKSDLDRLLAGFLDPCEKNESVKKKHSPLRHRRHRLRIAPHQQLLCEEKGKGTGHIPHDDVYALSKSGHHYRLLDHLVLSIVTGRGPGPDITHFEKAVLEAEKNVHLKTLAADAGYDSERAHCFAREGHSIRTIIPRRIGRPTTKLPSGKYRRIMATRFNKKLYGQRWQVETVNSMIKRVLGSALRARSYWSQCREMVVRVLAYNMMVLR